MAFGFSPEHLGISGNTASFVAPATSTGGDASGDGNAGSGGSTAGYEVSRGRQENILEASVNAEATLLQGGYNPAIADAVGASRGVGESMKNVERAASEYARMAQDAVREGRPPADIRFDDPNLSQAARDAIYAEAAQQNGTTTEAIERNAQERDQQAMQQLQQGILGGALSGAGITGALDSMTGQSQPAQSQPQSQAQANPFAALVAGMPKFAVMDMGETGAALANHSFSPSATPGMEQRQRGGQAIG